MTRINIVYTFTYLIKVYANYKSMEQGTNLSDERPTSAEERGNEVMGLAAYHYWEKAKQQGEEQLALLMGNLGLTTTTPKVKELIVTNLMQRGLLKNNVSTIRNLTQVYTKAGELIAQADPWGNFTQEDMVEFALVCKSNPEKSVPELLREWLKIHHPEAYACSLTIPL